MSGEGMMKVGQVREMQRINIDYWNHKVEDSTNSFQMGANVVDSIDETPA
jgi:hypothetical protein